MLFCLATKLSYANFGLINIYARDKACMFVSLIRTIIFLLRVRDVFHTCGKPHRTTRLIGIALLASRIQTLLAIDIEQTLVSHIHAQSVAGRTLDTVGWIGALCVSSGEAAS